MLKAMIVEDSRLARLELMQQLSNINFVQVVSEAESIKEALENYSQHQPDLLFLDIDLPDGSGFDFLARL